MPLRPAFLAAVLAAAPVLQEGVPVETRAPDVVFELQQFSARAAPPDWSGEVVNGLFGAGSIGLRERRDGWLSEPEHWRLIDVADRAQNLSTHGWLAQRGIRAEYYGFNEYQETIHLAEATALPLLGERGLARGALGELVRDPWANEDNPEWRAHMPGNAYIADPLEPRWSAIVRYDVLTSPLFGDALSQDNLGGPTSRMGPGAIGRFGNAASRGFAHWLERRGGPPAPPLRTYLRERLWGAFARVPPYAPEGSADASAAAQSLCADPVFAEFQIFQYAANLHVFARHYTDLRRVAARAGRAFDVHGNLDGFIVGATAYPMALGQLVDSLWFETSGLADYDQVQHGWWNALGSLRLELAEGLARGRKPAYFMTRVRRQTPEMVSLELAEVSAGGGVPLVQSPDIARGEAPDVVPVIEAFLRLRDAERELFVPRGRARVADVALLYSIPTFLFDPCVPAVSSTGAPPLSDLSGAARSLEEGHVPYDVVVLGHPDLGGDRAVLEDLARRAVVIAPSVENLSEPQLALLERYLRGGGTLAVLGRFGVRDERNRPRGGDALVRMRAAGRVVSLLGGDAFPQARSPEDARTRALADRFLAELRGSLPRPIIEGELPRTLWVKTWSHRGGRSSAHFVNYGFDAARARPPTRPTPIRLRLPRGTTPSTVRWLAPGAPARALAFELRDGALEIALPAVTSYGVLAIGPPSPRPALDRVAQAKVREREYLARIEGFAEFGDPVLALAFGEREPRMPWKPVGTDTAYSSALGYGWLPSDDDSQPSPEERGYRATENVDPNALRSESLLHPFWPFAPTALPPPLQRAIVSGRRQRLRLDLEDGLYRVSVVGANGAWTQRNSLVSGMVAADGRPVLLDLPLDLGGLERRAFTARVSGGKLELDFGGPTGFGVAALVVERADAEARDPLETGGVRAWSVSARHPNPDWVELEDVVVPAAGPWTEVRAAAAGLPLVDLGTLASTSIGDVVVARAAIDRAVAGTATLSVGASSAAHVYLNGERVLIVPNVKGVERDEAVARVPLRAGRNQLELVLERFWERRWMFYASVH